MSNFYRSKIVPPIMLMAAALGGSACGAHGDQTDQLKESRGRLTSLFTNKLKEGSDTCELEHHEQVNEMRVGNTIVRMVKNGTNNVILFEEEKTTASVSDNGAYFIDDNGVASYLDVDYDTFGGESVTERKSPMVKDVIASAEGEIESAIKAC